MPDPMIVISAMALVALGFMAGRAMTSEPSESEMFSRLVALRRDRLIEADVRAELDAEIQTAACSKRPVSNPI